MEPSKQQIEDLRQQLLKKLKDDAASVPGGFHPADMDRVTKNDVWLGKFLIAQELDMKKSLKMLWEALEWRKSMEVNDINESNVNSAEFGERIGVFEHKTDKDGYTILTFRCKYHEKGKQDLKDIKRYVVYWFEKLQQVEKKEKISVLFDMTDCGLSNMDLDFVKYFIGLFVNYYPKFLSYIVVLDMAWILNAAFNLIKTWLPSGAVDLIKFVSQKNMHEYIPSAAK